LQSKISTDKDKKYHESRIVKKGSSSVGSEPHEKKKQRKEPIRNRSDFLEDDEDLEIDPFSNNRKSNNAGLGGSARLVFSRENIRSDYFEGHHERPTPAASSSSHLQSQRRPTPAVITSSSTSSSYGGVPVLANTNSFV
jgi:hypothetical protein